MRKLVNAAMFRLNELRNEFLKIDFSEFHYIDGNLVELKLIPHEVEILYPSLVYPRPHEIQEMWDKLKVFKTIHFVRIKSVKSLQKGERIYIPPSPSSEEFQTLQKKKKKKKQKEEFDAIAAMLSAKKVSRSVVFVEPEIEETTEANPEEQPPEPEKEKSPEKEEKKKFR